MQSNTTQTYTYLATCPEELKDVLEEELIELGVQDIRPVYRGQKFTCDLKKAYEANLSLRTSSRIFRVLKTKKAVTKDDIFNCSRSISWHNIIGSNRTYKINASNSNKGKDELPSNLISKMVRIGLEEKFEKKKIELPKVELVEPQLVIQAHLYRDTLTICIDMSRTAMHKRGYKYDSHPAPIKETLACSLLRLLKYDGTQPLVDPMCGSGTIPIEASYIALNKKPLIHRSKGEFGFEWLKDYDNKLWQEVTNTARLNKKDALPAPIIGRDMSSLYLSYARKNSLRAKVEKYLDFEQGDFFEYIPEFDKGILIINLPYGERLEKGIADVSKEYYQSIGDLLKQNYRGWKIGLLVSENTPFKFIGLKPSRKYTLNNGSIPCKFLVFDIYEGSKKAKYD